jgi:rubrerythrin
MNTERTEHKKLINQCCTGEIMRLVGGEKTMLDVYYCESCDGEFAVKVNEAPTFCPFCGDDAVVWSHEAEEL